MHDIFITGTFRNDWNRSFNERLAAALETRGFSCHVPQRDTDQTNDRTKFECNTSGIDGARMLLAIGTKTQTANWGFEIGYAAKGGKPILIITDRAHPVEIMPAGASPLILVLEHIDKIESYIEMLLSKIREMLRSRDRGFLAVDRTPIASE